MLMSTYRTAPKPKTTRETVSRISSDPSFPDPSACNRDDEVTRTGVLVTVTIYTEFKVFAEEPRVKKFFEKVAQCLVRCEPALSVWVF